MGSNKKSNKKKKGGGNSSGKKSKNTTASANNKHASSSSVTDQAPYMHLKHKEEHILSELRTRTRSLLASMKGVAPDGAPFICVSSRPKTGKDEEKGKYSNNKNDDKSKTENSEEKDHPLALLHASIVDLIEQLMRVQREGKQLNENNSCGNTASKVGNEKDDVKEQKDQNTSTEIDARSKSIRDNPQVWIEFDKWLSACGIRPNDKDFPVEIQKVSNNNGNDKSGYGLFATRDIMHDEIVLEIPVPVMMCPYWKHCLSTTNHDKSTTAVPSSSCSWCEPPPPFDSSRSQQEDDPYRPLCLIMFIANERWRGSRSPFRPYLDTLPQTYSTPSYWSLAALREFGHTLHLKRAVTQQALSIWEYLQMRDAISDRHALKQQQGGKKKKHHPDLIPTAEFTYELFRWATATAHTRQNLIPFFPQSSKDINRTASSDDVQNAYGLIPLWDLLNHEDSDRACRSEVAIIDDGSAVKEGEEEKRGRHGVLICRTPHYSDASCNSTEGKNDAEEGTKEEDIVEKKICFRRGEQVTMHYGERSNAQLLFHSGFVNGGRLREYPPTVEHDVLFLMERGAYSDANNSPYNDQTDSKVNWWAGFNRSVAGSNHNKKDCVVLRLALPPAECDGGLDRVREMVAARFGFRAYVNQGCQHSGLSSALAAAKAMQQHGGAIEEDKAKIDNGDSKAQVKVTSKRDDGSVVMTEVTVSPQEPCPGDLMRALLVCMAEKEELAQLLRNSDEYLDDLVIAGESNSNSDIDSAILKLGNKHVRYVAALLAESNNRYGENFVPARSENEKQEPAALDDFWIDDLEAIQLSSNLKCTDQITLNAWFKAFCKQVIH